MIQIQTLHAEGLLTDRWITVEEVENDLLQHLESPTFDWYDDLLVRAIKTNEEILYSGVFKDGLVVDLGPISDVMYRNMWNYDQDSRKFQRGLSFDQAWATSPNGIWMLWSIRKLSSERMIEIALHIYDQLAIQFKHTSRDEIEDDLRRFRAGKILDKELIIARVNAANPNSTRYHLLTFLERLVYTKDNAIHATAALDSLGRAYGGISNTDELEGARFIWNEMADYVRELIPFTEVIRLIT